jgi:hypothetical protein
MFRRADGCKVGWMREQHKPTALEIREPQVSLGRYGFKVWSLLTKPRQFDNFLAHKEPFYTFKSVMNWLRCAFLTAPPILSL